MGVLDSSYTGCEVGRAQKNIFGFSGHPNHHQTICLTQIEKHKYKIKMQKHKYKGKKLLYPVIQYSVWQKYMNTQRLKRRKRQDCLSSSNHHTSRVVIIITIYILIHNRLSGCLAQKHKYTNTYRKRYANVHYF